MRYHAHKEEKIPQKIIKKIPQQNPKKKTQRVRRLILGCLVGLDRGEISLSDIQTELLIVVISQFRILDIDIDAFTQIKEYPTNVKPWALPKH